MAAQAIRNGVDTDYYRPAEDVPNERPGFVWVGSLIPRKEPNLMLDAFQQAFPREDFGPTCPHISMLGDGPLINQLASEADHSGVCLTGAVDDPLPYYQTASWFVSTSRSEGLPNAVLESLACGVPALLSDIPAHREIAEYAGEAVRLVPEQGTDAWAEALQTAASDPHLPERRHAARQAAEQHFSARATAQQYMALYEDLVQQEPNS
ncbi:glycosyltransferase [Halorhodospira halochloris]|uniref:Glycosyltransferase n=2 Tax=Halorhodospira halochloris TaxID=1052 RepID=A0A110B4N1_HALHR|nr:glycosyltransferase [Halorhodospira halochloris]